MMNEEQDYKKLLDYQEFLIAEQIRIIEKITEGAQSAEDNEASIDVSESLSEIAKITYSLKLIRKDPEFVVKGLKELEEQNNED